MLQVPCLIFVTCLLLASHPVAQVASDAPYFACGVKVGEATQDSAIVWVRLTQNPTADFERLAIFTEGLKPDEKSRVEMPRNVVPGTAGQVRILYETQGSDPIATDWITVKAEHDFTHQFRLAHLAPGKLYRYRAQARRSPGEASRTFSGQFKTAPSADQSTQIKFAVSTCQAVRSVDSGAKGHRVYREMLKFEPDFFVHTGDLLYYDKAPFCKSVDQARAKWNLMFAYASNQSFHRQVASYFMKDDHDTLKNDCWPGQTYGELTFAEGLRIFREQVPMGKSTYRTVRWGRDVQIWLTENRDFRSNNRETDGPDKTILGAKQKAWLMDSVTQSDATFKFVISPGPIVGPDKQGKADNHSNAAFANEGLQLREFLSKQTNTFVICGDRHWQYCSQDPQTGLIEMGCGPVNTEHNFGGAPGKVAEYHRYFGAQGGFLGITVKGKQASAQWFRVGQSEAEAGPTKVQHVEALHAIPTGSASPQR